MFIFASFYYFTRFILITNRVLIKREELDVSFKFFCFRTIDWWALLILHFLADLFEFHHIHFDEEFVEYVGAVSKNEQFWKNVN
jgi:hypothetical protein